MENVEGGAAVLVHSYPGQPSRQKLEDLAVIGKRPRKDYIEVAKALDGVVLDSEFLTQRATPAARLLARRAGPLVAQFSEALVRRSCYRYILAWTEQIGLPLALFYKLLGARRDLVLISVFLSRPKKAIFLRDLKVYSHLGALVQFSSTQKNYASRKLGVPQHKLYHLRHPVDDRFWSPNGSTVENLICAVGWEARDYATLTQAVRGLDVDLQIAIGVADLQASNAECDSALSHPVQPGHDSPTGDPPPRFGAHITHFSRDFYWDWIRDLRREGHPSNLQVHYQLSAESLRLLYRRARFVVLPLYDVDFDAGVTALTEALSMGKAVIVTRTQGQVDVVRHKEHGLYVMPNDPRALREAIAYLLDHPEEAARMGRAGRDLVERYHRLDDFVAQLTGIIKASDTIASN